VASLHTTAASLIAAFQKTDRITYDVTTVELVEPIENKMELLAKKWDHENQARR